MTGNIGAVASGGVIGAGSRRISETGLDDDIGRSCIVKMSAGCVGKAVVTNHAITRMSALRVPPLAIRPVGSGNCCVIRWDIMAGNAA